MDIVWILGGDVRYLAIDAAPRYINVGLGSTPETPGMHPVVALLFGSEDLASLTPLFAYVRELGTEPEVYLWDLDKEEPEILVRFLVSLSDRAFLETVAGSAVANLFPGIQEIMGQFQLLIQSAGNADRAWAKEFLRTCLETPCAAVIIAEAFEHNQIEVRPTAVFVTEKVFEHEPPPIMPV